MDRPVNIKCGEVSESTFVLLESWNCVRMAFDSPLPRCRQRLAFRVQCVWFTAILERPGGRRVPLRSKARFGDHVARPPRMSVYRS